MRPPCWLWAVSIVWLAGCVAKPTSHAELEHTLGQWAVAWSSGDVERLLPLFVDDVVYEDVTFGAVHIGHDALREFALTAFDAFPGLSFEVKSLQIASDGTRGALEWIWRGQQTKDLPGLPATNTPFEIRGTSIVEFRDGKISRCSDYWDFATFRSQVGLDAEGSQ